MTQITRVPIGLQDFLGTQAFGQNPNQLAQTVAPTLDIDRFIGIRKANWASAEVTAFSAPTEAIIAIPNNEVWILQGVGARIGSLGLTEGDSLRLSVVQQNVTQSDNPADRHPVGPITEFSSASDQSSNYQLNDLNDYVGLPGSRLEFRFRAVNIATSGTFNATCFVRYLELKV